jgi:hypothetical protein
MHHPRRWLVATVPFLTGALLSPMAGAAASVPQIPKGVVESQTSKAVSKQTGQPPPKVSCPSGLPATIGASIGCTLTPQGSATKYPVHATIASITGVTPRFQVQVGQAISPGNKVEFCRDNATLGAATATAHQPSDLIGIFNAQASTVLNLNATAPPKVSTAAGTLFFAARSAVASNNAAVLTTARVVAARAAIDAFCHQHANGSPIR